MHDTFIKRRRHSCSLRTSCRATFSAIAALLLTSLPSGAQSYPNNLSADSTDPAADSLFIAKVRLRMDEVRRREDRPTVALVLSGGGAKGAAEVGALKYIEEMGIPVDMVCGTSIGGMLGTLYAVGYRGADLEEFFKTQNWRRVLSDGIDQSYIPYATKQYNAQYVLTIPFGEDAGSLRRNDRRSRSGEEYEKKSLVSTLPSGMASGLNVGSLISSALVGFHDDCDFSELEIPYMSVATDVVSLKAKNWTSGSLQKAMRSTMSVPGLFDPVRTDGMVLVDGGTRNNFPADVARACGADYIIAIELSDNPLKYEDINNVADLASQFISMLGTDSFNKNLGIPDIIIKPHIPEFGMLSFNDAAVDSMLVRGYAAAVAKHDNLLALKDSLGGAEAKAPRRKALDISKTKVVISSVEFEGVSGNDAKRLKRMMSFGAGEVVGKQEIDDALSRFQATGSFASLGYSLLGSEEPYRLVFDCKTSPSNSVGLGFRLDTEEWATLLFNVGLNSNTLSGSRLNFTARLGRNVKGTLHYSLALPYLPTINFEASLGRYSGRMHFGNVLVSDMSYWTHQELLYFSDIRWTKFNFKAGLKNQYNNVPANTLFGNIMASTYSEDALYGDYLGAFLSGHLFTFDDPYYPDRGMDFSFDVNYDFLKIGSTTFSPVLIGRIDYKQIFPLTRRFAVITDLRARGIYCNNFMADLHEEQHLTNISALHHNYVGGAINKRYGDGHLPFFGIIGSYIAEEYLATAVVEMRYNPFDKLYVSLLGGMLESNNSIANFITDFMPDMYAAGLEIGYDFITGPVKMNLHWNDQTKWGFYFSFGYDF